MKLLQSFSVVPSIIYNSLPAVWKASYPFSSPCSVDVSDGPPYCPQNIGNSLECFLSLFVCFFSFFLSLSLSLLITLPQSGTCNRLWSRTLEFRVVPQSRLTSSLHNECALRRMDESIYSKIGQTHLNTWLKLQQLTPFGFACIALLPKLKLQPTCIDLFVLK